jgi:surface protein
VEKILFMFSHCRTLTSLNLSGWDISKVEDISYMFSSCF